MHILLPRTNDLIPSLSSINFDVNSDFAMGRVLKSGKIIDWEAEVFVCFTSLVQLLNKKTNFLDIGANLCYYPLILKSIFSDMITVDAIEPTPKLVKKAKELQKLNNIFFNIHEMAISDTNSKSKFFLSEKDDCSSMNEISDNYIFVNTTELDSFLYKNKIYPDIIKIDVEGNEAKAIMGGQEYLKNNHPFIFLEILNKKNIEKAESFLKNIGYTFYLLKKDFTLVEYDNFITPIASKEWNWMISPYKLKENFKILHNEWIKSIQDISVFQDKDYINPLITIYNIWINIENGLEELFNIIEFFPCHYRRWHAAKIRNISRLIHYEFIIDSNKSMNISIHFEMDNEFLNNKFGEVIYNKKDEITRGIPFEFKKKKKGKNVNLYFSVPLSYDNIMIDLYIKIMKRLIYKTYYTIIDLYKNVLH